MNESLVSIIIPAFKSKYLKDSLLSVLNQTYKNIEIIVVNDSSPENLKDIVSLFSDDRIQYYENKENIGGKDLVKNWNHCIEYCHGEYFILFSDDDLLHPNCVEEMLRLASQYPDYNVYKCRTKIIDAQSNFITFSATGPEKEWYLDFIWHQIMSYRSHTASEFLYRTAKIKEMGGFVSFPIAYYSDYASVCKFIKGSYLISTTQDLVSFRMSGDNLSTASRKSVEKTDALFQYVKWMNIYLDTDKKGNNEKKESILKALEFRIVKDYLNYITNAKLIDIIKIYKTTPPNIKSVKILMKAIGLNIRRTIYQTIHI